MSELSQKKCQPCEGGVDPLSMERANELLAKLENWSLDESAGVISRTFRFDEYGQTVAFANAVAWIAHRENHHPDMFVGYDRCELRYTTHAIGGLSENDFICAAKVDELLR